MSEEAEDTMKDFSKLPHAGLRRTMELREKGLCSLCGAEPLVTKLLCKTCRDAGNAKRKEQYRRLKEMLEKGGNQ